MVLVLLGTCEIPFVRPLIEIEKAIMNNLINEEVIVQCGKTNYPSKFFKQTSFFKKHELEEKYKEASYIICQAGIGSIMMGMAMHKKIISIPRLKKLGENVDDHQSEILYVFSQENYIIPWYEEQNLPQLILQLPSFKPAEYPFREEQISNVIIDFLNNQFHNS